MLNSLLKVLMSTHFTVGAPRCAKLGVNWSNKAMYSEIKFYVIIAKFNLSAIMVLRNQNVRYYLPVYITTHMIWNITVNICNI
jgi:hypothetical protein